MILYFTVNETDKTLNRSDICRWIFINIFILLKKYIYFITLSSFFIIFAPKCIHNNNWCGVLFIIRHLYCIYLIELRDCFQNSCKTIAHITKLNYRRVFSYKSHKQSFAVISVSSPDKHFCVFSQSGGRQKRPRLNLL